MKKLFFILSVVVFMLFSCTCFAAPVSKMKVIIGPFEDNANKSTYTGAKDPGMNTALGDLNANSAMTYVLKEMTNSGKFDVLSRMAANNGGVDLYVDGAVTNCAVKVSSLGYDNANYQRGLENRKYTINIDIVVFVSDYESQIIMFGVDGHGESSCTGTEVKNAEHTVTVGAERVTDDSITSGMKKACHDAVQAMIRTLKKQGRLM